MPHHDGEELAKKDVDDVSPCYWFANPETGVIAPYIEEDHFKHNDCADFYVVFVATSKPLSEDELMMKLLPLSFMPPEGDGVSEDAQARGFRKQLRAHKKNWFTHCTRVSVRNPTGRFSSELEGVKER